MSALQTMAAWSAELDFSAIPTAVVDRTTLSLLSNAGAARRALATALGAQLLAPLPKRGKSPRIGRKTAPSSAVVGLHAGLLGASTDEDYLLWASTAATTAVAWTASGPRSELISALVAGNEIAGRVGLAGLLSPSSESAWSAPQRAGAAAVAARLGQLSPIQTAHAIAIALSGSGRLPAGHTRAGRALIATEAARAGVLAAELAAGGTQGDLDLLERPGGVFAALGVPSALTGSFAGLGSSWLSDTLSHRTHPVTLSALVPIQALDEVLQRHMAAADKRLRPDQWDGLEFHCAYPHWSQQHRRGAVDADTIHADLSAAAGLLGTAYSLSWADIAALDEHAETARGLCEQTQVLHSWPATVQLIRGWVEPLQPLFSGLGLGPLHRTISALRAEGPMPEPPSRRELVDLARARPDRLAHLGGAGGDLEQVDLSAFRFCFPTEIFLGTTRGGRWPERRSRPLGSPGCSDPYRATLVRARYAAGDEARSERSQGLVDAPTDASASEWLSELLS